MQCKLKKKCPSQSQELLTCWKEDCDGYIHEGCCKLLLDRYEVPTEERPSAEDVEANNTDKIVFCTKTCYLSWKADKARKLKAQKKGEQAAKKRPKKVPWEEDGSLTVLMDWITEHGNYAAYSGSSGNKGKTKSAYYKQIAEMIRSKNPSSERTEKDVENKITALERQFRTAVDWANNTGQGVENPGDFKAALLKRCPLYEQLEPIMGERPNAVPLSSNEPNSDDDMPPLLPSRVSEAAVAVDQSLSLSTPARDTTTNSATQQGSGVTSLSSKSSKSSRDSKRLTASDDSKKKRHKKGSADDFIASIMQGGDDDDKDSLHTLRIREVTAREQEAAARMMEAQAISDKAKKETAILSIDERVKILRERKKLLDDGICTQDEIDRVLPLPK